MAADDTLEVSGASAAVVAALAAVSAAPAARTPGIAPAEYAARRAALAKAIDADALFMAFSFEPVRRTGDIDFPFRQEDNLLYLTGMTAPDTTSCCPARRAPGDALRQRARSVERAMDGPHPLVAGGDRRERGERRAAFATLRRIHRRGAARHRRGRSRSGRIARAPGRAGALLRVPAGPRTSGCCCSIAARAAGRRASSGSPRSCARGIRKCGSATRRRSSSRGARSRATRS